MSGRVPGSAQNPFQYSYYPDRPPSRQGGSSSSSMNIYGMQPHASHSGQMPYAGQSLYSMAPRPPSAGGYGMPPRPPSASGYGMPPRPPSASGYGMTSHHPSMGGYGMPPRPPSAAGYSALQRPPSRSGTSGAAPTSMGGRPGANPATVYGRQVATTAVAQNGFTSAFSGPNSNAVLRRGNMQIPANVQQSIMRHRADYIAQASRNLARLSSHELNRYPDQLRRLHETTLAYSHHYAQRRNIETVVDALDRYQADCGDNYLMNVNAMGYPSLRHYLTAVHQRRVSEQDLNHFVQNFNENYGVEGQTAEEFNDTKTHIERNLRAPTAALAEFLGHAPRISGVTVQKGMIAEDNLYGTRISSNAALRRVLNGDALLFNGFLSTTSSSAQALQFSGINRLDELGSPMYTIDLRSDDPVTESLRRTTLAKLRTENWNPSSLIFNFAANNARGIHVDAMDDHNPTSISFVGEKEILFAPGHSFQANKVTFCSDGCVIDGELAYSR